MLLIDTELKPSSIAGFGVFLKAPVKAGDLVWQFDGRVDRILAPRDIEGLPEHAREDMIRHTCWHAASDVHAVWGDNARFLNHADDPNLAFDGPAFGDARAVRDIAAGEELTCDYAQVCDWVKQNGNRF